MLAILVPKRPCPWCGVAVMVPPALPDAALARRLEQRCGSCRGGVHARAPWTAFLLFVGVYGAISNLLLWCVYRAWEASRAGDAGPGRWLAIAVVGFVVITLLAQRYLIGASELLRGRPPRGDGG